jgi:uncharacterized protein with PIN domain
MPVGMGQFKLSIPDTFEPSEQRFVVDLMLMRLGRWLRLMGQDVANPGAESDWELIEQAARGHRTVITRDRRLWQSCLKIDQPCILIFSSQIEEQLLEMAGAGLPLLLDPRRCTLCNEPLQMAQGREQWHCRRCDKLYWRGSHWRKMEQMLEKVGGRREKIGLAGKNEKHNKR